MKESVVSEAELIMQESPPVRGAWIERQVFGAVGILNLVASREGGVD